MRDASGKPLKNFSLARGGGRDFESHGKTGVYESSKLSVVLTAWENFQKRQSLFSLLPVAWRLNKKSGSFVLPLVLKAVAKANFRRDCRRDRQRNRADRSRRARTYFL